MLKFTRRMVILSGALVFAQLVGCSNLGSNQEVGALTGGVLGGVLGSHIGGGSGRAAAIIGGSIIGSMMGSNVGADLDEVNRMRVAHALDTTRLNHSRSWVDHHSGGRYTVRPVKSYHHSGKLCRQYQTSILIRGELKTANGRACRDAHGNWTVVQ